MHFFRGECSVTGVSLSVNSGLGASTVWAFLNGTTFRNDIRNTIPFRLVTQWGNHLTKAAVQTSINNLNVFKSFQLMLAAPSTLLSNAMKFARINARSFKYVLSSTSSEYMCHYSSNIKTNSFPSPLPVYDTRPGSPKKADRVSKKAKINHIAVLRHAGYTYSKTCITKQKYNRY